MKRILVVIDPAEDPRQEGQRALTKGLQLARCYGAELELFVCDYNQHLSGEPFFDSKALEKARKSYIAERVRWLEGLAASLDASDVELGTEVVWDHPHSDGVARKALRWKPDLVIKDARRRHGRLRSMFSHTDWHLLRTCPAPLLLVKTDEWPEKPVIVAAVDPTHVHDKPAQLDHAILRTATSLGEVCSGDVHVFHAYSPVAMTLGAAAMMPDAVTLPVEYTDKTLEKSHRSSLDQLLASYDVPEDRLHFEVGPIEVELESVAERLHANVVVMGAVARGHLARWVLGSTAERTLDELPCDVLVVKPADFDCPVQL